MCKLKTLFIAFVALLILAASPVAVLAQRTSVGRDFPVYNNGGKPDLTVDPKRFVSQMEIVDRFFDEGSCAFAEGLWAPQVTGESCASTLS